MRAILSDLVLEPYITLAHRWISTWDDLPFWAVNMRHSSPR
jgi:hypothetical protein